MSFTVTLSLEQIKDTLTTDTRNVNNYIFYYKGRLIESFNYDSNLDVRYSSSTYLDFLSDYASDSFYLPSAHCSWEIAAVKRVGNPLSELFVTITYSGSEIVYSEKIKTTCCVLVCCEPDKYELI